MMANAKVGVPPCHHECEDASKLVKVKGQGLRVS